MDFCERTAALLGADAVQKLKNSRVIIFGIGGVGAACAEALTRGGIGSLTVLDKDVIAPSNINRQLFATSKNIGCSKISAARARLLEINPDLNFCGYELNYLPDTADSVDLSQYDYAVDAVDCATAKLEIIVRANAVNTPVISSMGTANKLDATRLEVADIYSTSVCPLARVMRTELKKRSVGKLKTVYSREQPVKPLGGQSLASCSFVPPAAGMIIAGEVIKDLTGVR